MPIYYLLPILLIGGAYAYANFAKKQALAQASSMSPEEAADRFHQHYGGYFDLASGETVVGAWSGLEFQGASGAGRQVAGAALNSAAAAVIGVSTYVPNVHVGLTSTGRVLVSREYSELGERGNFKQVCAFGAGTRASGPPAGQAVGASPKNPFNPAVPLEFVQLRAPSAEIYEAWMSPQGGQVGHAGFRSILQGLG